MHVLVRALAFLELSELPPRPKGNANRNDENDGNDRNEGMEKKAPVTSKLTKIITKLNTANPRELHLTILECI